MKLSDMFPRKYATGADLNGRPVTLTIARIQLETMRPYPTAPDEDKPVVYFETATKGIILTQALAYQIDEITGSTGDTDNWIGQRVTLYPVPMKVAGQQRIAIRARAPQAQNGQEPPVGLQEGGEEEE